MTREEAICKAAEAVKCRADAERLVPALEALGLLKLDTPESVHSEACKFIHSMSAMWGRTNPGAVVEDLGNAGYKIVRA